VAQDDDLRAGSVGDLSVSSSTTQLWSFEGLWDYWKGYLLQASGFQVSARHSTSLGGGGSFLE
jgi:predicted metalloprotease with PDZ domain